MKRNLKALQRRRLRAARSLVQGVADAEVARRVGVSRQSVNSWAIWPAGDGQVVLKAKFLGRPGGLGAGDWRELVRLLKQSALVAGFPMELWALARVEALIAIRFGQQYSEVRVCRLLRGLGFSCQRPIGRTIQRDAKAIRERKQRRWPALKKTP
jgi:transposase